jgi:phosphoribosyl 1,2-cyclic phosphodiesterase
MLGLDDLRQWTLGGSIQKSVNVYLTESTMKHVQSVFPYLVDNTKATGGGDVAGLSFHIIKEGEEFTIDNVKILPILVEHGINFDGSPSYSLGFRIDKITYISDVSKIPSTSRDLIKGSKLLILDALHDKKHISHFSIDQALEEIKTFEPTIAFLTGFSHRVDHYELEERLKGTSIYPAYDGLCLEFNNNAVS